MLLLSCKLRPWQFFLSKLNTYFLKLQSFCNYWKVGSKMLRSSCCTAFPWGRGKLCLKNNKNHFIIKSFVVLNTKIVFPIPIIFLSHTSLKKEILSFTLISVEHVNIFIFIVCYTMLYYSINLYI